jgi:hypothetical protein
MTPQEHAAQLWAVRASLLADSARLTHHDVYALRTAAPPPVATVAGAAPAPVRQPA